MPLYTFNFTSTVALGEARVITQSIELPDRPPRGARFYIRQVSAVSTDTFANSFKYINVYVPELMSRSDIVTFQHYETNASGTTVASHSPYPGFRYFLNDNVAVPYAFNAFPNLNLGRHFLESHYLTLQITPFATLTTLGKLYSFSVVIEWSSE